MIRFALASSLVLCLMSPAAAQEHADEEAHEFTAGPLTIVHPWARAASAGSETLVFMEIENTGAPDTLLGAQTGLAEDIHIVGLSLGAAGAELQEVGAIPVPAGHFALDPGGLALELHGLTGTLEQGSHFDVTLEFEAAGAVDIEVLVEPADATQHSHAGHSH